MPGFTAPAAAIGAASVTFLLLNLLGQLLQAAILLLLPQSHLLALGL
jgi:hypothetical protein